MGTLDTIKKAKAELLKKRAELSNKLWKAKTRKDFLLTGSVQKEEFKKHIFEDIDRQAENYTAFVENLLMGYQDRRTLERPDKNIPFFGRDRDGDEVVKQALFCLHNQELKDEASRLIDACEWPDKTVPLPDEREKEDVALTKQITALNNEIYQLDKEAEEAGINLQQGLPDILNHFSRSAAPSSSSMPAADPKSEKASSSPAGMPEKLEMTAGLSQGGQAGKVHPIIEKINSSIKNPEEFAKKLKRAE